MKYIWKDIDEVIGYLKSKSRILVLLDYDGTIVPITSLPSRAVLPDKIRNILRHIAQIPTVSLGIVSGRSLSDIKKLVGISGIIYAGVHGLEWEISGKAKTFNVLVPEFFEKIKKDFTEIRETYEGMFVEDKKYSLSVHYRLLPSILKREFMAAAKKILAPYVDTKTIRLHGGKKVIEIKPISNRNKGTFVQSLIHNRNKSGNSLGVVYIGDDVTDEDVFRQLTQALTIHVGKGKSDAVYYLKSTSDTVRFLLWLQATLIK